MRSLPRIMLSLTAAVSLCSRGEDMELLKLLAEAGDAGAQSKLGDAYYAGKEGVAMDYAKAAEWYRKAAEKDDAAAQYGLGRCYLNGEGVKEDLEEAISLWRKAAAGKNADAQYRLGALYCSGELIPKDDVEAVKWYRKAAEQGHAIAQHNLASHYCAAEGVEKDEAEAFKWYRKAAEQGDARSQYNVGVFYQEGRVVSKDEAVAADWYRKAAEQNYPEAQYNLGICYVNGVGVSKDRLAAYKWILLALAQGMTPPEKDPLRFTRHMTREEISKGQKMAFDFTPHKITLVDFDIVYAGRSNPSSIDFHLKSEGGNAKDQNELGEALHAGSSDIPRNPVAAAKCFRKAAEQNLSKAQFNLGHCYYLGEGVPKYDVEAYKWYLLAAAQGETKAKLRVSMLESLLSPEEIAEGKKLSEDWLRQHTLQDSSPNLHDGIPPTADEE